MKFESDIQKINQELFGFGKPKKPKAYKECFLTDTGKREVFKRLKEAQNELKELQSKRKIFKSISYINWSYKSPTLQNLDNEFEDMESRTKFDINVLPPIALKETNKILEYPIADYKGVHAPYDDYYAEETYDEIVRSELDFNFDDDSDVFRGGITVSHKVLFDGFKEGKDYKVVYIDKDNNILESTEGYDINNESLKEYSFKPNTEVLANLESINNNLEINTLDINIDSNLKELFISTGINMEGAITETATSIVKNAYNLVYNIGKLVVLIIKEILKAIIPILINTFKAVVSFLSWLEKLANRSTETNTEAISNNTMNILDNDEYKYLYPYMYCVPGGIKDIPRILVMYLDTVRHNLNVVNNVIGRGDYNSVSFKSVSSFIQITDDIDRSLTKYVFNFEISGDKVKYNIFNSKLAADLSGAVKYNWRSVETPIDKKAIKYSDWNMDKATYHKIAKEFTAQKNKFEKAGNDLARLAKTLENNCKGIEKRISDYLIRTIDIYGNSSAYFTTMKHNLKTIANIAKHSYITTNKNLNHFIKIFGIYTKHFSAGNNSAQGETK